MRKFLVSVSVFVFSFVLVLVPCFASEVRESDSGTRSVSASVSAGVYSPVSNSTTTSIFSNFSGGFYVGTLVNGQFERSSTYFGIYKYMEIRYISNVLHFRFYYDSSHYAELTSYSDGVYTVNYVICFVEDNTYTSSVAAFDNYFEFVSDPGFPQNSVINNGKALFGGVLGFGGTLIDFISDNWIAILPLVLWVLIALFGVFRKLFKGV